MNYEKLTQPDLRVAEVIASLFVQSNQPFIYNEHLKIMNTMSNFNQTLAETKNCFSYDLSRKKQKSYCRLKSIERFNQKTGFSNDKDIHGLLWHERVILEITSIDLDSKQCFVKNPNGLEWLTKLSNIVYCDVNGNANQHSER